MGRLTRSSRSYALVGLAALLASVGCHGNETPGGTSPLSPSRPDATLVSGSGTDIIPLGQPGFPNHGDARGLNSSGQVTGAYFPALAQDFQPYRWDATNGLTPITGCCDTRYGSDINDAGVVVGTAQTSQIIGLRGFVATGTTMTTLSILPGANPEGNARAVAINDAGQIVGQSVTTAFTDHAVLWSAAGVIQDLGTLGGTNSAAIDINASGQVIGSSQTTGDVATHYFLWSSAGGMQDLNTTIGATITSVVEINDAGQIIGTYITGAGQSHAFLYTPASGLLDLGTLGGTTSAPTGLNDKGQVVGSSTLANGATHAFLWTPTDGMEDVTVITGAADVRRLNDNLQTLSGAVPPTRSPTLSSPLPKLLQLTVTNGNQPPVASFTVNCVGQTYPNQCAFDASGSTDDVGIVSYKWEWGDGRSETKKGSTARNTWSAPGVYTVTLTVTDAAGLTGSVTQQVAVGTVPNQAPVAAFTYTCAGQSYPHQCAFDASSSTDDSGIVSYKWDWGNGRTETKVGTSARNTWASAGNYTVTLTVTDGGGLTGTSTQQVTVP
jgi:probable HAF family extracellular repeat protein